VRSSWLVLNIAIRPTTGPRGRRFAKPSPKSRCHLPTACSHNDYPRFLDEAQSGVTGRGRTSSAEADRRSTRQAPVALGVKLQSEISSLIGAAAPEHIRLRALIPTQHPLRKFSRPRKFLNNFAPDFACPSFAHAAGDLSARFSRHAVPPLARFFDVLKRCVILAIDRHVGPIDRIGPHHPISPLLRKSFVVDHPAVYDAGDMSQ